MRRVTDTEWDRMRDLIAEEPRAAATPGRKPGPTRDVLDAVL
jgi:hypothetical protein